jgi:small GTP-binding protein
MSTKKRPSFVNVAFLGGRGAGKTSLINAIRGEPAPILDSSSYMTESHVTSLNYDGKERSIQLFDIEPDYGGRGDFGQMMRVSLKMSNVLVMCINIGATDPIDMRTESFYASEAQRANEGMPILLVGTQADRSSESANALTRQRGEELAREIGAVMYLETSSVSKEGVKDVFERAVDLGAQFKLNGAAAVAVKPSSEPAVAAVAKSAPISGGRGVESKKKFHASAAGGKGNEEAALIAQDVRNGEKKKDCIIL